MAQTDARPGFRLPWTAERVEPEASPEPVDAAANETERPKMIDAIAPSSIAASTSASSAGPQTVGGGAMTADPAPAVRRPTKLMADLSKAMQVAAEHARDETMSRFDADAKTMTEEINATSTAEAANLRRRADDDVAAVREWSKAEIARVRELTEERIGLRKAALDGEMNVHASVVQARIERVAARVATYRTDMDEFFGRLLAEQDPTRIATMAEMMPEPPSLTEIAASIPVPEPAPFEAAPPSAGSRLEATAPPLAVTGIQAKPALMDFAAAEAEAAQFSTEPDADAALPAKHDVKAATASEVDAASRPDAGTAVTTRVVVLGLVSVASIAAFKRDLGRTAGVTGISVASGPDGEFVFTVTHESGLDLPGAVAALEGFEARITATTADSIEVAAQDPDAVD